MLAIGADHGGYKLKEAIKAHLDWKNIKYRDFGTDSEDSCDYPVYAKKVCEAIQSGECEAGILVCGDLDRAFRFAKDYWVIDGAIAAQNICLAAQELGLGAVWLGTWPQMDRVEAQKKLFALPETIVPHSIIALGYPEADITAPRASRYEADRVHFNQW